MDNPGQHARSLVGGFRVSRTNSGGDGGGSGLRAEVTRQRTLPRQCQRHGLMSSHLSRRGLHLYGARARDLVFACVGSDRSRRRASLGGQRREAAREHAAECGDRHGCS